MAFVTIDNYRRYLHVISYTCRSSVDIATQSQIDDIHVYVDLLQR